MIEREELARLVRKAEEVTDEIARSAGGQDYVKLARKHKEIEPVAHAARSLIALYQEADGLVAVRNEEGEGSELAALADSELRSIKARISQEDHELAMLLLARDADDDRNVIVEVRAGTGGDEAGLFAADLQRMYTRYAQINGWKVEPIYARDGTLGGFKDVAFSVTGAGVFARLKFESGVHRVQRVPQTESSGRIHTSAATVAVLPEPREIDVVIDERDLKIDVYRASGAGGQHVNTTESAVRITHVPSGIVVTQQDERSQHRNRDTAMKILRARLFEKMRADEEAQRAAERKTQVGSGDRSERIRTYNFPQGRVTDHRIGLTLYKLDRILLGDGLDEVLDALIAHDQAERLASAGFQTERD